MIPQEIGNCHLLETLCLQGNHFSAFPCSFIHLTSLKELSLEWFLYAKPSRPQYVSKSQKDGTMILESLFVLCSLLLKHEMKECALITFLENFSESNFNKD